MKLAKYLANLGYGTRREVERAIGHGRITSASGVELREGDAFTHEALRFDGAALDPAPGTLIMLHKPAGYVCSTNVDDGPVVYELLPPRFRLRSPIIAPVGRLDIDTSGLLLLTDDGKLNHRLTSPRSKVPKTYAATLASDLRGDEAALFASGELMLKGDDAPLKPAVLEVADARHARVTITEGRYHQVRRMFAAVGNRVEALHRERIGDLDLGALGPGNWRALGSDEITLLTAGS